MSVETDLSRAHSEAARAVGQMALMLAGRRLRPLILRDLAAALKRSGKSLETIADRLGGKKYVEDD